MCVKAGVHSNGQRGQANQARLVVEGALSSVWLLPSPNSQPNSHCSHILKAPNFNFLQIASETACKFNVFFKEKTKTFCLDYATILTLLLLLPWHSTPTLALA